MSSVSVIIPCYNSKDTIFRAVNSVHYQTMKPLEVIIVDDGSDSETVEFLQKLKKEYAPGWVKLVLLKENKGVASARNAGWDLASQDFVAFLDSDDSWHEYKIEKQYGWMLKNKDIAITGHDYHVIDKGFFIGFDKETSSKDFFRVKKSDILYSNKLSTPTVMIKRDIPFRFKNGKRFSEDYQLWLEIILSGYDAYKSSEKLAFLYKAPYGSSGLSSDLWGMEKGELDSYRYIFLKKHIGFLEYIKVSTWSFLKYIKRLFF